MNVIKGHQMTPLIRKFELYWQQALGIKTQAVAWTKTPELPLFLREAYDFYEVNLTKKRFLLAADRKRAERPPAMLQKQLAQIELRAGRPVVYLRTKITSHNRHRLIMHQVPFVVPGNQLYLPMFCIDLRERFGEESEARTVMSPSTQVLVLHVQRLGIGEHNVQKKNRQLTFGMQGKELWQKVLPLMRTPVRERAYVEQSGFREEMNKAGLTALAHYSMIAKPEIPVYACAVDRWRNIRHNLSIVPMADAGVIQVEVWTYRPELFAMKGIVDRLSLYLSLRNDADERISSALDTMMREIQW
jgi:hypothetical protein